MSALFIKLLNLSLTASWVVMAVLLFRLILRKAPKWINCLLWGIVGLRLVMPFSFESILSLIPSAEPVPQEILMAQKPAIDSGFSSVNTVVNPILSESLAPTLGESVNPMQVIVSIASYVWLIGLAAMLLYGAASFFRLSVKVRASISCGENAYACDFIDTPFILGIFKPRIYLPSGMSEEHMRYVIEHENAHLRRKDHLWKPIGFALLSVYWFNPILWVAYILLCRDIEMACDEKVIKEMEVEGKKGYSEALLACSIYRRTVLACPLAFGEVGVKARIRSVLHYRKPAFGIIAVSLVVCLLIGICFLTDPMEWGVKSLSLKSDLRGNTYLKMEYAGLYGSYQVQTLSEEDADYCGDGTLPYDGSLGKYRIMINFSDTDPSKGFCKAYPAGEVCVLQSTSSSFPGTLKVKRVHPSDHGFVLYIGSDVPIAVEKIFVTQLDTLIGSIKIPFGWGTDADVEKPIDQAEFADLREKYPAYFDLDTSAGLTVYVWQMAEGAYSCGLLEGTTEDHSYRQIWSLKSASIEEMKVILASYGLPKDQIHIVAYPMPYSSYRYIIDDDYITNLETMFS